MNAKEILDKWVNNVESVFEHNDRYLLYSEREVLEMIDLALKYKSKPKGKTIEERKEDFRKSIEKYYPNFSLGKLREFYDYWTEHGENDKKMRFEKEKSFGIKRRLATWKANSKKWDSNKPISLASKMKKQFGV